MALPVSQAVMGYDRVRSGRHSKVPPCRTTEGTSGLWIRDGSIQPVRFVAGTSEERLVWSGHYGEEGVWGCFQESYGRWVRGFPRAKAGPRKGDELDQYRGRRRNKKGKREKKEKEKTAQKSSGWKEQTSLRHTHTERLTSILYCVGFLFSQTLLGVGSLHLVVFLKGFIQAKGKKLASTL
ncbi:uncharacterized protein LY79DRAFT_190572 [Colletotrichum navitas]|uniref:Uncharacterized protein n=1 Tax=Colletotrichum navitas TaxID=681940 RepID=A0AAD8V5A5_9PEZI|nr:uncharacterized protein LY79DRAFT_190572 [Colletotrichum navitas]KAK1593193.1 hypothetical protein LY79DRAFT_190572 [Colletotrichum navitas]